MTQTYTPTVTNTTTATQTPFLSPTITPTPTISNTRTPTDREVNGRRTCTAIAQMPTSNLEQKKAKARAWMKYKRGF